MTPPGNFNRATGSGGRGFTFKVAGFGCLANRIGQSFQVIR
jgi:hypothetical protein